MLRALRCAHHADRGDSLARCVGCLLRFCRECLVRHEQFYYCAACAPRGKATRPAPVVTGFDLREPELDPEPTATPEAPAVSPAASILQRGAAFTIDALLVGFVVILVSSRLESSPGMVLLVMAGLPLVYEALFVQQTGQTLGKAAMGIAVVSADGSPASDAQAWGRAVLKVGQLGCCGLSFLSALLFDDARGFHDHGARTRVARAGR